jgi:UrcA family protein
MARKIGLTLMPLIAAVGLVAAPAHAGERQTLVHHTDLDLSTEVGQAKFKQRVMRAVRNVCAFPSAKTLAERQDQIQCEARAKTSAMRKAAQTIARNGGQVKVALD